MTHQSIKPLHPGLRIAALLPLLCGISTAHAEAWHAHDAIEQAAEDHVRQKHSVAGGRSEAVADALDSRLRLPACEAPLQTTLPYAGSRSRRLTVEVQCGVPTPWKLYVPVNLTTYGPVVVAKRPLPRNTLVSTADVTVEERELGLTGQHYVTDIAHVAGLKLKRTVAAGTAITSRMLATPILIERGQAVTVAARSGTIAVRMTGIALRDGGYGDIIEVRNLSSERQIQGIVKSAKIVEVLLQ